MMTLSHEIINATYIIAHLSMVVDLQIENVSLKSLSEQMRDWDNLLIVVAEIFRFHAF